VRDGHGSWPRRRSILRRAGAAILCVLEQRSPWYLLGILSDVLPIIRGTNERSGGRESALGHGRSLAPSVVQAVAADGQRLGIYGVDPHLRRPINVCSFFHLYVLGDTRFLPRNFCIRFILLIHSRSCLAEILYINLYMFQAPDQTAN
jgi:hypothetical protein